MYRGRVGAKMRMIEVAAAAVTMMRTLAWF